MIYFNLFGGILSVHSAGIAFSLNKLVVDQWKEVVVNLYQTLDISSAVSISFSTRSDR